jgi:DNA mismatch repair protein MutL
LQNRERDRSGLDWLFAQPSYTLRRGPSPIQQLNAHLVNRIAAGEVIERPAAVVKELVENAIDAGATSVVVECEDGGRALIRVIDDGGGIPADELPLAFARTRRARSATTTTVRDRYHGLRGEALASIGAVSHARILSARPTPTRHTRSKTVAALISDVQARRGTSGRPSKSATSSSTRRLGGSSSKARRPRSGTSRKSSSASPCLHPNVTFKLVHNGRTSLDLPATSDVQRMLSAWPKEFAEMRLGIDARDAELRLRGLVGLPELARPTAKYQFST